ncbi:hypothetical protein [Acetomicrobium sp.]|uniref:hypothetical protein n=1 Tax=Acetomicrobium sp. TaxID=1872099 RepID=UPI002871A34B|nr:hypothetical protein [Acetomicrobium sp.]MDR9768958.1 hypothetical protein [Acetomicrobium sp.]
MTRKEVYLPSQKKGVMIAASYWSLLAPAIEMSEGKGIPSWVPPAVGFLVGGVFMRAIDALSG